MQFKHPLKTIIVSILFAILFGFVAACFFVLFQKLIFSSHVGYMSEFIGAFMGAFFAFLFIRIGDALTKIYERLAKNYNALIKLQHYLNDMINMIDDNIYKIDGFLKIIHLLDNSPKPIHFCTNRFITLPIDREIVLSLTNMDLVNKLFSFNTDLRKLNDDMDNLNRTYDMFKIAFLEKQIDENTYIINTKGLKDNLTIIREFLVSSANESKILTATSRVLAKDKPILTHIITRVAKSRYSKTFKKSLADELTKLTRECENTERKSSNKIDQILKTTKQKQ